MISFVNLLDLGTTLESPLSESDDAFGNWIVKTGAIKWVGTV
jgi:hypothetical protein